MDEKTLKPHQKRVHEKLERNSGVLVYHGLGSGKTLTALSAADYLKSPISIIGPASLRGNFEKEKTKHKIKALVDYSSYTKPEPKTNKLLVFDEAHRMGRYGTKASKLPSEVFSEKKLLLTGTPIRNHPSELAPLLNAIGAKVPKDPKAFNKEYLEDKVINPPLLARLSGAQPGIKTVPKNLDRLTTLAIDKVDYHPGDPSALPKTFTKEVYVPMSTGQSQIYKEFEKGRPGITYKIKHGIPPGKEDSALINSFLSHTRQISNNPQAYSKKKIVHSPKSQKIQSDIVKAYKKDPNYKGVTYSAFLDSGINPLSQGLTKKGIPHASFTGETSQKDRARIIKDYNSGKIKQLLISGAGSEGLDLKGTSMVQLMEPHWNSPRTEQVIGRAVRMGSHDHLPQERRKVNIRHYYSTLPKGESGMSTDLYLKRMSEDKKELNKEFLTALQRASLTT